MPISVVIPELRFLAEKFDREQAKNSFVVAN